MMALPEKAIDPAIASVKPRRRVAAAREFEAMVFTRRVFYGARAELPDNQRVLYNTHAGRSPSATGDVMQKPKTLRLSLLVCGAVAALSLSATTLAQHVGGHVGAVGRGGYGGYHGGYGYYRGGYGWGGWRGGWGYGPWGWGGLGLGLYFATLPLYYSTYWWDGVPYYYADNTYYRWNGPVGQYETVSPPPELLNQSGAPAGAAAGGSELIAYPKNGQSQEQQGKDKFECHRWASTQTGFDPTQVTGATPPGKRSDYYRAQAACLEGRGYSVK